MRACETRACAGESIVSGLVAEMPVHLRYSETLTQTNSSLPFDMAIKGLLGAGVEVFVLVFTAWDVKACADIKSG